MDALDRKISYLEKVRTELGEPIKTSSGEPVTKEVQKTLKEIVGEKWAWYVGKLPILSYNSCKKLFLEAKLEYVGEPKLVCGPREDNKQQHIWVLGIKDTKGNVLYSEGEASKYNTGKHTVGTDPAGKPVNLYSELNEIDAKYRSRMAYKRAFCRCVMDILGLEEFYSDSDASEFKKMVSEGKDIDADIIEAL